MSTRNETKDWASATSEFAREMLGKIRRVAVTLTSQAFWQIAGHTLLDGSQETRDVEPFNGIGVFARPPDSSKAEAIVVFVGGPRNPIIVACRDEATRQASAGDLAPDEAALYNTKARMHVRADGVIELHPIGSPPNPLDGVVTGTGIDPYTGMTYAALGNASAFVRVKK